MSRIAFALVAVVPLAWASLRSSPAPLGTSGSFTAFDAAHVRPLALAPGGARLFAVNTPDARLEVFDVTATGLAHAQSIPVGLEPVALAARSATEVWVVNHLSDSVSIVDLSSVPPRVVRTLLTGDEPRDIVFAGPSMSRAFITCAHRGQNAPFAPQLATPSIGRADVWVFDTADLGTGLGGTPLAIVTLFGDTPRALAASPDGSKVYAAVFASGNRTTTIHEAAVPDGSLPAPHDNAAGVAGPETGLIVGFDGAHWVDGAGTVWDAQVKFSLPDKDVFVLDASATPPVEVGSYASVGTTLFNMTVNPASGEVYVSNTESLNRTRFSGIGAHGGSTVRGHVAESRITLLGPGGAVAARHLNKHVNYAVSPGPSSEIAASLAIPLEMAVTADGATLYVAAFGSSKVGIYSTAELASNSFVPDASSQIVVSGGGPTGLALDESRQRLYVLTRFDDAISVVDTALHTEIAHVPMYNPEPPTIVHGRPFLYDASESGHGDTACASCHVFGDTDHLGWDLGDPDGNVATNPNPFRFPLGAPGNSFHPMKGPMVTQSLRGLAGSGPMHWRGDRTGGSDPGGDPLDEDAAFKAFNAAFGDLLGRGGPIPSADMQAFSDFALRLSYPPNPIRSLDNTLTSNQQLGANFFRVASSDAAVSCESCHRLNRSQELFGADGESSDDGETQQFKIPHLRNAYQKVGMFGMPDVSTIESGDNGDQGPQIRGFGFSHDGSIDTIFRFVKQLVFHFNADPATALLQRNAVQDFMFAFDTNLAPIVGQQITLTAANAATAGPRIDLMIARCSQPTPECDLIVKGSTAGQARGWRLSTGQFLSDRAAEPALDDPSLRALAAAAGGELTYTAMPPGSGVRAGVDRDEDGTLDRDELDAGSDPANPLSNPGDLDGDGFANASDCGPTNPAVYPGATEICDGLDNDCDPATVDGAGDLAVGVACDGADWDECEGGVVACLAGVRACTDDPKTNNEICNGVDDDCNGTADDPACAVYDVDGSGRIDGLDLAALGRAFGQCPAPPATLVDFNQDDCVDGEDLAIFASLWGLRCSGGVLTCP